MSNNNSDESNIDEFSDESLREIAAEIVKRRLGLKIHVVVYVLVNALLFVLAALLSEMALYIPAGAWGLGLLIHAFSYVSFRKGWFKNESSKLIAYHSLIALGASALLFYIDGIVSEITNNMSFPISWSLIPIAILVGTVLLHLGIFLATRPKSSEDPNKGYIDRKIEKELEKVKKSKR